MAGRRISHDTQPERVQEVVLGDVEALDHEACGVDQSFDDIHCPLNQGLLLEARLYLVLLLDLLLQKGEGLNEELGPELVFDELLVQSHHVIE